MTLDEQLIEAVLKRCKNDKERKENIERIDSLLEKGASANAVDYGILCKTTVLLYAVAVGKEEVVELLVKHGANVNSGNSVKGEPSSTSFVKANEETVKLLAEKGINVGIGYLFQIAPLHMAVAKTLKNLVRLLLEHGAEVNTKYYCNAMSVLLNTRQKRPLDIFFLLLLYGADVDKEHQSVIKKINNTPDLKAVSEAFKEIKAMSHLGKLIEANIKRDKKESAKIIAKYVNDEAKKQELIEEFQIIKEKYSSDKELSFVLKCLPDVIRHVTLKFLKSHIDQRTIVHQLHQSKDDIKVTKECKKEVQIIYENLSEIASKKIVSYLDNDTEKNVLLALCKKADILLNKLRDACQNPNPTLTEAQSEAASSQSQSVA